MEKPSVMDLVPASPGDAADCIAALRMFYRWEGGDAVVFRSRPGWMAVPYEMGGDLSEGFATRIASVASATGDPEVWVVVDEPIVAPKVFVVKASPDALDNARDALSIHDVVILPRSQEWFVLASEAEFGVLLGERENVAQLAGFDPSEAAPEFQRYMAAWVHVPSIINAVADLPWESYQHLPEGAELLLRWS